MKFLAWLRVRAKGIVRRARARVAGKQNSPKPTSLNERIAAKAPENSIQALQAKYAKEV